MAGSACAAVCKYKSPNLLPALSLHPMERGRGRKNLLALETLLSPSLHCMERGLGREATTALSAVRVPLAHPMGEGLGVRALPNLNPFSISSRVPKRWTAP